MSHSRVSPSADRSTLPVVRYRLVISGVVQGVGFRPFVHRLAHDLGLMGWVLNSTEGVVIEVEGGLDALERFVRAIPLEAPPRAVIERLERVSLPPIGYSGFSIETSREAEGRFVLISPDVCVCDDCLRELRDPVDRRHGYPFVNCTNCGPRFTIVADIPYDRPKTTMACFPMCPDCEREYRDPSNRRFHAQPNACPVCGPRVWLVGSRQPDSRQPSAIDYQPGAERGVHADEHGAGSTHPAAATSLDEDAREGPPHLMDEEAMAETRRLLESGAIVAIKGLGGFHLACNAANDDAVAELRRRKRRTDKPFAVMSLDADTVASYCHLSDEERQLLESPQRPIVLLRRREEGPISSLVAPHNRFLGVMLPYTPLHYLLLEGTGGRGDGETGGQGEVHLPSGEAPGGRGQAPALPDEDGRGALSTQHSALSTQHPLSPQSSVLSPQPHPIALVMTSGNLSEEPIATGNREAMDRLGSLADAFLLHNRDIQIRCDDSVTRLFRGKEAVLRRSRGYAPFPVRLGFHLRDILACGAQLKNSFCITKGDYAFLSQHIGDLENAETLESFATSIEHFHRLFRLEIEAVAHDMHPDYLSTRYAWELAGSGARHPLVPVQHHHAHVAACMAENGVDEPVIGVAFDGTGYGDDGEIWGGEFLVTDFAGYRRAAHLKYLPLPGGDAAVRRPYRMAVSYLLDALGPEVLERCPAGAGVGSLPPLRQAEPSELTILRRQVQWRLNSPFTSSAGRLFDAVSSLAGIRQVVNYEGQAAIELEMAAREDVGDSYHWTLLPGRPAVIDMAPCIRGIVEELARGTDTGVISARFHNTVAEAIAGTSDLLRQETGISLVALSGGVFQNLFLLERSCRRLEDRGFRVLIHHQVPANDGGIALGQAMIANRVLEIDRCV